MKMTLNEDTLFEDGLKVKTAQIRKWLKKKWWQPKKRRRPQNKDHLKMRAMSKRRQFENDPKSNDNSLTKKKELGTT